MKYIYLIQSLENGYYKIGVSKHPAKRVEQLQTGNASPLKLIDIYHTEYADQIEHALQRMHAHLHKRGEWFDMNISNEVNFQKECKQISVKEASVTCGYSDTYVKNTKALIYELYDSNQLGDELFDLFDEAYKRYSEDRNFSTKEEEYVVESKKPDDIPPSTSGEDLKYRKKGNEATIEWKSGSNYPVDHIKTLEELLKATNVDTDIWNVAQYWENKWDVTAVIKDIPRTFQNFQVKARLEKKLTVARERAIGELFKEMI